MNAADVFISYARENRATASQLADALAGAGLRVWWDRDLVAGSEFSEVIEQQLDGARVVIALWSADSVRSAFVRDESARALRAGKLLPVRIEDVELPLGFGQIHTLDLLDWDGDADDEACVALLAEARRVQGQPDAAPEPARGGWLRRWRLARHATAGVLALGLALFAWGAKVLWDKDQADEHFRAGLEHQHAKEPELENALNEFLSALERRPGHARAHFYLARIYVLQGQRDAALESYQLALAGGEARLDAAQRAEAKKQLVALVGDPDEVAPVARSAANSSVRPKPSARPGGGTLASAQRTAPAAEAGDTVTRGVGAASAPAATSRRPPRIDPPAATQQRLAAAVDAMFGDNRDQRITATTNLVVDPEALSDAVPIAVAHALAVLRTPPLSRADSSGVVNTLVLLKSALPGTLESNRTAIEALVAAARELGDTSRAQAAQVDARLAQAATRRPVAFIQIANEAQRALAQQLAARFESFGYDAPGIELVGARAPAATELRVHGRSDRGYARWVTRVVTEIGEAPPAVTTLRNVDPKSDAYEIWLDRDLCAPGGRQLAGCKAA